MTKEQLSTWVDAELDAAEASQVLNKLGRSQELRDACGVYWLIGDVLREQPAIGRDLQASVMASLMNEPTVLAPVSRKVAEPARWLPMAAAVAGVAVAAWMGLGLWSSSPPLSAPPQMAQTSQALEPEGVALLDDQSYLMAHQASAVGAPIAGVAQYVRTAGFEQVGAR